MVEYGHTYTGDFGHIYKGGKPVLQSRKKNNSSPYLSLTYIEKLRENRFLPIIRLIVLFTNISTSEVG